MVSINTDWCSLSRNNGQANLISCLQYLCNQAVRVICGLQKFDHVSDSHYRLVWLPFNLLVQYRALITIHHQYILIILQFLLSHHLSLDQIIYVGLIHHHTLAKFFVTRLVWPIFFPHCKATMWWKFTTIYSV